MLTMDMCYKCLLIQAQEAREHARVEAARSHSMAVTARAEQEHAARRANAVPALSAYAHVPDLLLLALWATRQSMLRCCPHARWGLDAALLQFLPPRFTLSVGPQKDARRAALEANAR